jgi:glycosyltransferase involved in cell wall biosynthesis
VRRDLPRDILLFSTADWDNPFWTNKQHMAARLADRGYRVLYLDSLGLRRPTLNGRDVARMARRLRQGLGGLRRVGPQIWVCSPLVIPAYGNPVIRRLNRWLLRRRIQRTLGELGFEKPIFWTYNPLTVELVGRFDESMLVYHCVDDLTAVPGTVGTAIAEAEETLVRRSDLIFTTSPRLQETRARWNPDNTYYFPNVADFTHFAQAREPGHVPDDLTRIPGPRIGFIGAISDYKVDFDLIARVADARRDWQWVLIGLVGEGQPQTSIERLRRPNIHLLGPRPYGRIPEYLRGFDVAVLPMRQNDYTASMFPMKFFEYLAAGVPVVATDLLSLRLYSDACVIAPTPDAFTRAIAGVLEGRAPDRRRCLELAQQHTWQQRLNQIEGLLTKKWDQKAQG